MAQQIMLSGKLIDVVLDVPTKKTNVGIIFIPGVSSGALIPRFDELAKKFKEAGYYFLRFESWKNISELEQKSIKILHKELDNLIDFLHSKGCNKIGVIGKSLGGGISLTYRNPKICCMVLWAPAIGISEESNVKSLMNKPFSEIKKCTDIKINRSFLSELNIPIIIIHGTKDDVVPIENSQKMVDLLNNGKLAVIIDADHSFKTKMHEKKLFDKTLEFFRKKI